MTATLTPPSTRPRTTGERGTGARVESFRDSVVIRLATTADRDSLAILADLDCSDPPTGPVLIAVLSGRPVAARSLSDGKEIADPFVLTGDALQLLRLRAHQLAPSRPSGARTRSLLRRWGLLSP